MDDASRQSGAGHADDAAPDLSGSDLSGDVALASEHEPETSPETSDDDFEETLFEEASALIDDGRTYVEAELAFQKTRAKLAGRLAGASLGLVVLALILLHIALLALAVGLVIALAPLVTIWGAILIVVGALLLAVGLLGWLAMKRAQKLGGLFSDADDGGSP
ncbi:MAG: phage holin family protein [Erythrobacter sp.]